jgi:hypothetical protein
MLLPMYLLFIILSYKVYKVLTSTLQRTQRAVIKNATHCSLGKGSVLILRIINTGIQVFSMIQYVVRIDINGFSMIKVRILCHVWSCPY